MAGASVEELKARADAEVDRLAPVLVELSHDLHAHPELMFEEHHAHQVLTDAIAAEGLQVVRHAHGLDTAFRVDAGSEGPIVAVCCEYDALENIGHACGHNVIATAGLGAGLAAAALAEAAGGRVRLLGTPAEEGGSETEIVQFMFTRAESQDVVFVARMEYPFGDTRSVTADWKSMMWYFRFDMDKDK